MIRSVFPVLAVDDLDACRDFYAALLDLDVAFECGWYTSLTSPGDTSQQVAFVSAGHHSVPDGFNAAATGCLVTVEVDDVDAVHTRAVERGLVPVQSLRDEEFGQRHFMLQDPNGTLLDVISWIPPSRQFVREVARWRRSRRE